VKNRIGQFWATVIMVEIMDVAFSIDNVFAAVAFTPNIALVCFGVFIGILTMRLVAQYFTVLISKYPFLETSAFVVIFVLGLRLSFSILEHFFPSNQMVIMMESNTAETVLSIITAFIFFIPLITSKVFNYPKHM
jgi:predicted tellurium resistance membrane protein TerC